MRKIRRNIEDKYLLIEIINQNSLNIINSIFNTHYLKKHIKRKIEIKEAPEDFDFYKKLMEQKPKKRVYLYFMS